MAARTEWENEVMGIFDALTTAVSGLSAQSFALQNISGNIANSQTTAFKGLNTEFEDLIGADIPSAQISGSVLASSSPTNNVQGDIQNATTSTFMAINGDGFFQVQQPTSFNGNQPVFNGTDLFTRRGDFQLDQNGFLVNGAGFYLMGLPINPQTGNPEGSVPTTLQFNNNLIPAVATSQINYDANLPSQPVTTNTQSGVAGSNLLNPDTFAADPLVTNTQDATITGTTANLLPDAEAQGTGTTTLVGTTALTSLANPFVNGDTITINDGKDAPITFTVGSAPPNGNGPTLNTVQNLVDDINDVGSAPNAATLTVHAALNASGQLVLTSTDGTDLNTVSISSNNTNALASLGFASGNTSFQPTNLLTQGAVTAGQTLIVAVGTPPTTTTLTFGTGANQISTLTTGTNSLLDATQGLGPTPIGGIVSGGSGIVGNGNLKLEATSGNDITITGTANAKEFGLTTLQAFPANGTVFGIDQTQFLNESVSGGSITSFNGTGTPVNVQFRWAKVDSSALGAGHADTWNLFYETNSSATNTEAAWVNVGTNFTFNSSGQLTPALNNLTLDNVNINGQSLGNLSVIFGSDGLTQFANTNGTVQVNQLSQNGSAAGELQSIAVDNQGRIVGTFTNGETVPLAQITLANFNGPNNLEQLDGGAYEATADSGPPLQNATGQIVGSALEASNVDIADQFSLLIVTQQAYSANTRVITTTDNMVQDLLDVIH
jgi:flagellar hook protein FlgE